MLASLVLIAACNVEEPSGQNGFRFYDAKKQRLFVEALKKEGIRITIQEDGTVLYSPKDEAAALRIRSSVLETSFVPSIHYADEGLEKRFVERLKAEGIGFGIEIREGERWITWSKGDEGRVEKIRAALLDADKRDK